MKFILIFRHTDGADVPEKDGERNLKDMGEWVALLKPSAVLALRGGKSVTAAKVDDYRGDVGGVLVFEAENLEQAVSLAKRSPGLKFGFTHEVLPEVSLEQAAQHKVKGR
jgi:hypothetical protein